LVCLGLRVSVVSTMMMQRRLHAVVVFVTPLVAVEPKEQTQ